MPKKRAPTERPPTSTEKPTRVPTLPTVSAEAALSFLDTRGTLTWSVRDLVAVLRIDRADANQVIALLQAQGYVQPVHGSDQWATAPSGETVSDSKPPRFTRESVDLALASLKERVRIVNKDSKAAFKIGEAVAFGDFPANDHTRVQAADVGLRLLRCYQEEANSGPHQPRERRHFLYLDARTDRKG
jgi:hypothetical protein